VTLTLRDAAPSSSASASAALRRRFRPVDSRQFAFLFVAYTVAMSVTCPVCKKQMRHQGRTFRCGPCRQFIILLRYGDARTAERFGSAPSMIAEPGFFRIRMADSTASSELSYGSSGRTL
jgi:hypothetical protein